METKEFDPYEGGLRCSGRTTRLVDTYIQDLFTNREIVVQDHYDKIPAHQELLDRITRRLNYEHPRVKYSVSTLTVKLIQ